MSPRTKEQFEAIREKSKAKIMQVAFELFAEHGYYRTSIAQVAAKAGVSKGLIYNYFESKEALLMALVRSAFEKVFEYFPYMGETSKESAEKILEQYIRDSVKLLSKEKGFWRMVYALILQKEVASILQPMIVEYTEAYMPMIYNVFKELGAKNPVMSATLFGAHFDGIALGYITLGDVFDEETVIETLIDLYIPKGKRKK